MYRPAHPNGQQRRSHNGTFHPQGTISPSLLQARPANTGLHKQQPSVTSIPVQDTAIDSVPFPDLPSEGYELPFHDSGAHVARAGLMSTIVDTGAFDISFEDLMTPDYSTDNHISEHTTPQEAIWEREFQQATNNGSFQPHILDTTSQHSGHEEEPRRELQAIYANEQPEQAKYVSGALLSPQLTTPSPPGNGRQRPAQPTSTQSAMNKWSKKRGAESLQLSTDTSSLQPHPSPHHRPVSPVIMVSSHSHGDSPAHATPPRHRSLSRSRQSPIYDEPDTYSMLMPPGHVESASTTQPEPRTGVDPSRRGTDEVPTVNQLAERRQLDERNQEVADWLSKNNLGTNVGEERMTRQLRPDRPRALSAGFRVDPMGLPVFSDRGIPGPGALIDEDSHDEYSTDGTEVEALASEVGSETVESPPVMEEDLHNHEGQNSYFPRYDDGEIPPEQEEPLPGQFYRRGPWQDPLTGPIRNEAWQPFSSNAAMVRYNEEAARWETASRAATWGTRRRLSDSEVQSIVDGSRVRHLSLVKRGRARGSTLIKRARDKANDLIPRRSNSNIKKAAESPSTPEPVQFVESPQPREQSNSANPLQRIASFGKSRSPPAEVTAINTSFANSGHIEAVSADSQKVKSEGGLRSPLHLLRKARSKSDVGKNSAKSSPGIHELMAQHGGPPVMSMASPKPEPASRASHEDNNRDAVADDEDDETDEVGIRMDLQVRAENIIPNLEGFKYHAKQLNPRLPPYLIDRIGHEQLRRYKKLLDQRVKHKKAVLNHNCAAKGRCFELGGEAKLLTPRKSAKDPDGTCVQFSVRHDEDAEDETEEGVVAAASFPAGIPPPPVRRLPAEFECSLCFKVKSFQKPSDWTKHIHEDVQPFSCTFPNCNEPKSFKRKADWVRHENERHRRLEYWQCNVQGCTHVCYRKDNFVQHLVREHKKNEPKVKKKSSAKNRTEQQDDSEVWSLVDACRQETDFKPRDEPCKFCGNVCSSWKKLSVHMGNHMVQIAMPILELVNMREVTADTIISPVEQSNQQLSGKAFNSKSTTPTLNLPQGIPLDEFGTTQFTTASPALPSQHDPSLSPYAHSVHSHHVTPINQSPAIAQVSPHLGHMNYSDVSYYQNAAINGVQAPLGQSEAYETGTGYDHSQYAANGMPLSTQYGHLDTQVNQSYSPGQAMSTPLSGHSMSMNMGPMSANSYGHHDSQYGHNSTVNSLQHFPPTSQPGHFNGTGNEQDQYTTGPYSQQQNMYHY